MKTIRIISRVVLAIFWCFYAITYFIFITPVLILILIFSPLYYRKAAENAWIVWSMFNTALIDIIGIKLMISGDAVSTPGSAIYIANHRTYFDWLFFLSASFRLYYSKTTSKKYKFFVKDSVKFIPIVGWLLQFNSAIFLKRSWKDDQSAISRHLKYYQELKSPVQLFIFAEGSRFCSRTKERSNLYALEHGLPVYNYVLNPRSKGFVYNVQALRKNNDLDAVYDITIGIDDSEEEVSWKSLKEVHIDIRRISNAEIPEDEQQLKDWLDNTWNLKEQKLKAFYENKCFSNTVWYTSNKTSAWITLFFMSILKCTIIALLVKSYIFQLLIFSMVTLFLFITHFSNGLENLEIDWYWKWKQLFSTNSK